MSMTDRFIAALRRYGQTLPDPRTGRNTSYGMADFVVAAFAPFFMQSPSFLAHQRQLETERGRSNCQTLFGMAKIPGDSQVRAKMESGEARGRDTPGLLQHDAGADSLCRVPIMGSAARHNGIRATAAAGAMNNP